MSFAKRLAVGLLASCFSFCIVSVAVLSAVNVVFGTPDALKDSLVDSRVYDSVAAGIVDQATTRTKKQQPQQKGNNSLDSKVAQDAMRKDITPQRLQGYAEQIVDGTYNWLEGNTDKPDYVVDLSTIKKDLGVSVGDSAVQRIQGLPICTQRQLSNMSFSNASPFTLPCRPPGINLKAERQKLINEVTRGEGALQDTTITADDTQSETGETPFERLFFIPTLFQWGKTLPLVLGLLAIASAIGIIFMQDSRRTGIKAVAKPLLATGVFLLIGIMLVSFLLSKAQFSSEPAESQHFQEALVALIRTLNTAFRNVLLVFAIVYTVLGAGGLIGLRLLKAKNNAIANHPEKPAPTRKDRPSPNKFN